MTESDQFSAAPGRGVSGDGPRSIRIGMMVLVAVSLVATWINLGEVARSDHWFRNADMNIHNMVDALSLNADQAPNMIDQPGVPMKFLLALHYRIQNRLGLLPVWSLDEYAARAEPLAEIGPLIRSQRIYSRLLVMAFMVAAGALVYQLTREVWLGVVTLWLCGGASGLMFHAFITRPELLCVGFGLLGTLSAASGGLASRSGLIRYGGIGVAGVAVGLATLTKLPGMLYGAMGAMWCAVSLLFPGEDRGAERPVQRAWWGAVWLVAVAAASFWLMAHLRTNFESIGQQPMARVRGAATGLVILTGAFFWSPKRALAAAGMETLRSWALLGAGMLATFPACYAVFRTILSEAVAKDYLSRVMLLIFNPFPFVNAVATNQNWWGSFLQFWRENTVLYAGVVALFVGVLCLRKIPLRSKARIGVVLAFGLGLTLVMSKRHYLHQYNLFSQAALVVVIALSLHALFRWWGAGASRDRARQLRWGVVIVAVAGYLLALGGTSRAFGLYRRYQDDALPTNPLTVLFFYNHDAHTRGYLETMQQHYGSRDEFSKAFQCHLSDPANRY